MSDEVNPQHKRLLDKIRTLFIESGGKSLTKLEDILFTSHKSELGGIEVYLSREYVPFEMYTRNGFYLILGNFEVGDPEKFWELFNRAFRVEVLRPQTDSNGLYVRITERD